MMNIMLISGAAILGIVVGIVAVIAIIAFIAYKVLNPKLKTDDKPSEEEAASEELDRILKPIDDQETAKKISEYKDKEDE